MFAIKLLSMSEDDKTLLVHAELYWMPKYSDNYSPTLAPSIFPSGYVSGDSIGLFHNTHRRVMHSGYALKFHTSNPQKWPLPSFKFLEMQWVLHRVAAHTGDGPEPYYSPWDFEWWRQPR